jgi:hypothetical protein
VNSYGRYTAQLQRSTPNPWSDLANAIVADAADDYRRLCSKKVRHGATMADIEMSYLNGKISEIEHFFNSDWGNLLSRGLAPAIWERLHAEFAGDIERVEAERAMRKAEQEGES